MTDLKAQRRMAADVLDVGKNRVWFDPEAQSDIAEAITREDIRELVDDGTIRAEDAKGNSKGRARERAEKRSYGHRKGPGSRKGKSGGRKNSKDEWISRIRAQRRRLKELRDDGPLTPTQYRELYNKASGGEFDSVDRLEAYITNNYDVEIE
ncbi:50S ribosomal protein L19e [Halogeometricum borinquense]|uniref:Large ribosomal subunit protein eL19 n=2 Tax=Halogeometricum borinquense TaxID=60847 RepID=E4NQ71_HALBP|nr:50S ribosomal protein L19e [Halogeometricum borinquense]ADQ66633.1 LSU ribosomal protein L19E [Halogeometricum borinquense DSM 11551]ELY30740.1 50S ribosomal protein L19e [Halogeometricum borinquense DSM 11551]QIB75050.1 50S ribosomal protein L19e [Halogeometricum borinquense]QIQ75969.1 50S ribosomal protein L19e [Halogeometricum borinquense]RYJ14480.1 50S ribosomal protein L19e [Halogeometricum borinquense]